MHKLFYTLNAPKYLPLNLGIISSVKYADAPQVIIPDTFSGFSTAIIVAVAAPPLHPNNVYFGYPSIFKYNV